MTRKTTLVLQRRRVWLRDEAREAGKASYTRDLGYSHSASSGHADSLQHPAVYTYLGHNNCEQLYHERFPDSPTRSKSVPRTPSNALQFLTPVLTYKKPHWTCNHDTDRTHELSVLLHDLGPAATAHLSFYFHGISHCCRTLPYF